MARDSDNLTPLVDIKNGYYLRSSLIFCAKIGDFHEKECYDNFSCIKDCNLSRIMNFCLQFCCKNNYIKFQTLVAGSRGTLDEPGLGLVRRSGAPGCGHRIRTTLAAHMEASGHDVVKGTIRLNVLEWTLCEIF
jgi:hypothetical protein